MKNSPENSNPMLSLVCCRPALVPFTLECARLCPRPRPPAPRGDWAYAVEETAFHSPPTRAMCPVSQPATPSQGTTSQSVFSRSPAASRTQPEHAALPWTQASSLWKGGWVGREALARQALAQPLGLHRSRGPRQECGLRPAQAAGVHSPYTVWPLSPAGRRAPRPQLPTCLRTHKPLGRAWSTQKQHCGQDLGPFTAAGRRVSMWRK